VPCATCAAVLVCATGTFPRHLMPVPLCWAGSEGIANVIFRIGLTTSGLLLAFAVGPLCRSYASLLDVTHFGILPEFFFLLCAQCCACGLCLLAAVPLSKEAAINLRDGGELLSYRRSLRDWVHAIGAFMFFGGAASFYTTIVALSALTDRVDLPVRLMLFSKFLPPASKHVLHMLLLRITGAQHPSPAAKGCAQYSLLCAMGVFISVASWDKHVICSGNAGSSNQKNWFPWLVAATIPIAFEFDLCFGSITSSAAVDYISLESMEPCGNAV